MQLLIEHPIKKQLVGLLIERPIKEKHIIWDNCLKLMIKQIIHNQLIFGTVSFSSPLRALNVPIMDDSGPRKVTFCSNMYNKTLNRTNSTKYMSTMTRSICLHEMQPCGQANAS